MPGKHLDTFDALPTALGTPLMAASAMASITVSISPAPTAVARCLTVSICPPSRLKVYQKRPKRLCGAALCGR
jgi:hypothetical protein